MALCTSCGNQVEESASFCTSCGKPMPAAAHPSAAVTATRPVCSACGAQVDHDSVFCNECGTRLDEQPPPIAEVVPVVAAAAPPALETAPPSLTAFCTNCGTSLDPGTGFCTNCGQPVAGSANKVPDLTSRVAPATPALETEQTARVNEVAATSITPKSTEAPAQLRCRVSKRHQPQAPLHRWPNLIPLNRLQSNQRRKLLLHFTPRPATIRPLSPEGVRSASSF
jgi:hypothetical protein